MKTNAKKTFCIGGAINPDFHYFVPHRLDWVELERLIANREYFVLHAPRQSGKTTAIKEFARYLHAKGSYHSLYINVEAAQAALDDVKMGLLSILDALKKAITLQLPQETRTVEFLDKMIAGGDSALTLNALGAALSALAMNSLKPIVLFMDEIDSLIGDTLLSVLRQIRAGFDDRPTAFPHALCLIGLRDVRDYRIWSRVAGKSISTSSPFNIKSESLILPNFSLANVNELYAQHTAQTGQSFTAESIEYVHYLTAGQPWLVNALAYQVCYRDIKDPNQLITKDLIERAKDALILRRDTHIDSLLDKLHEKRVRPIMEAILTGVTHPGSIQQDDLQYVRDLGLIGPKDLVIANPIYREIIPRELTYVQTELLTQTIAPFKNPDGSLNTTKLLEAFTTFFRENSAIWLEKFEYKEAGPHLLMMAFLQRVINGGGTLQREYALGTGRVDLLIRFRKQTIVIELKLRHGARTWDEGLQQTALYMDASHATEAHLVIFDRDPHKSWDEKIFHLKEAVKEKTIHVWGM